MTNNSAPPRVTIISLTHNGWADTNRCLASLAAVTTPSFQIVLVDNASTDGTVEAARASYPTVTVIENGVNLGFAEGNNVGLRYAMKHQTEYALLLNNDVEVAPDFLEKLVMAAQQEPRAALLGPMVYHFEEPRVIQSAGGEMPRPWQFVHRGQNEMERGQFRVTEEVAWLTGCALFARTHALERFGLLDPAFFMYGEDVDWCLRARASGYTVVFAPEAKVWHRGVRRDYAPEPRVTYYSARNELLLLRKHRAGVRPFTRALARDLRTLTSWTLRPRWRTRRGHRDALARALRDFALARFGAARTDA